jgi:hypothetical protein
MTRAKSKAVAMTSDGAGGVTQLQDRRFEDVRKWPGLKIPPELADSWLKYLSAQCERRRWRCSAFAQMDRKENSGSITVYTGGPDQPQLAIVWERKRGGPIGVRYRSVGATEFPLVEAGKLFETVSELCRSGAKERVYCRGQLVYEGLPWRGELWLDDTLRLGPPIRQDEMLLGSRVILVDAEVPGIEAKDAFSNFAVTLRELAVFLSVVMRMEVRVPRNSHRQWTFALGPDGKATCELRFVGYCEPDQPTGMPTRGIAPAVPLKSVHRPDFSSPGIVVGTDTEQYLPADIGDLWQALVGLPPDLRLQFLQVGSMWQTALSVGSENRTARFAWTVAACEALKPHAAQYRNHNIYHVINALLGTSVADLLKEQWFQPQNVRNAYFHSGEFRGSEFVPHEWISSYQDPTFDKAARALAQLAPAAILEWLMRGGTLTMPPLDPRTTARHWMKEYGGLVLWVFGVGLGTGIIVDRVSRRSTKP